MSYIYRMELLHKETTAKIIDAAYQVHASLGPGLLESTYQACLHYELIEQGLFVESQKALPVVYKEVKLECGYRIDLLVEKKIVIEIKSVEALNEVHMAQVLTYLKLSSNRVGFLINFNVKYFKEGLKRGIL